MSENLALLCYNAPMINLLSDCRWPTLPHHYDQALRAAVEQILARFDAQGIIACGSIIRGNPNPGSDFDIHVIHAQPQRQRIQHFFHNVPAEIFVNPPQSIRGYFATERKEGRPSTAHMLTTGFVILDRDPIVEALRAEARAWLQKRPDLTERALTMKRYFNADEFENALDIAETDPVTASLLMHHALFNMVAYRFLRANQNVPRHKELLSQLDRLDPAAAKLIHQFLTATDFPQKFAFGQQIAETMNEATGFFPWESEVETVGNGEL